MWKKLNFQIIGKNKSGWKKGGRDRDKPKKSTKKFL